MKGKEDGICLIYNSRNYWSLLAQITLFCPFMASTIVEIIEAYSPEDSEEEIVTPSTIVEIIEAYSPASLVSVVRLYLQ